MLNESIYFLIFMNLQDLNNSNEARRLAEILVKEYPLNPQYRILLQRAHLKNNALDEARNSMASMETLLKKNVQITPEKVDYWKEKCSEIMRKYYETEGK